MTRVCHFTSAHPWDDIRIFHKECRSMAAAGFDVHLVASGLQHQHLHDGVHVHQVDKAGNGGRLARMLKTSWRVYRTALKTQAEIFHFHDPELLPYGLLLRLQGKLVVYDVHEDVPRDILSKNWIPKRLRKPVSLAFEIVENTAARLLSAIVCATPFIAERFNRHNKRTIVINNYPSKAEFATYKAPSSARKICYVGGIARMRGAVEMIKALEYTDATLILAGRFESPSLEVQLRQMPGWQKVDYRGFVNRLEVQKIYAESSLGLLTLHPLENYKTSQPIKLYEYMLAGRPVIASDFELWRSIVEKNNAGLCINPLEPKEIAEAISTLLEAPAVASAMGEAGRRTALQHFMWESEVPKLSKLYNSLCP